MLDIAIIIIGYHTKELVKNCLESLRRDAYGTRLSYKVAVVDNNSQDGTAEMLARQFPEVTCLAIPANLGYPRGVNLGLRSFTAKYYLILNPDVLFTQGGTLDKFYAFMEKNPQCGLVGPKLLNPDGTVQMSCFRFPSVLMPLYRRTFLGKLAPIKKLVNKFLMTDWNHEATRPVDWLLGTGMFVRQTAITHIGLMDERFFMFFEDVDWCRRFWMGGWQVLYAADIQMVHYHIRPSAGKSAWRDLWMNKTTRIHIQSWLKYLVKYIFKFKVKSFYKQNTMESQEFNPTIAADEPQAETCVNSGMSNIGEIMAERNDAPVIKTMPQPEDTVAPRPKRAHWKTWLWSVIIAAILIFIVYPIGRFAYHLWQGKATAETAIENMGALDFLTADKNWDKSLKHWRGASSALDNLAYWRALGLVSADTYQGAGDLLQTADDLTRDIMLVNTWAQTNIAPIKESGKDSVKEIDSQLKKNLLQAISESGEMLKNLDNDLMLQDARLEKITAGQANGKMIKLAQTAREKLQPAREALTTTRELLPMTVAALGYPEARQYLFALQNNGEMRPTGGYIGTYGTFEIKDGEFVNFATHNTYYLDLDGGKYVKESAPAIIRQYLRKTRWMFSDANWSPDFPTSVAQIEKAYKVQSQDQHYFDGMVIMDPKPIVELLALSGPLTVVDKDLTEETFTSDNFVDKMEDYTYSEFAENDVTSRNRKNLIGDLGLKMITHFLQSSLSDWQKVGNIVLNNLNEKHVIFNFKNTEWQNLMAKHTWDGTVKNTARDYLMVVDANLDSRKTDRWTEKDIKYRVYRDAKGNYLGEVTLTYRNTAPEITEKTRVLKEYIRVYTPSGSQLLTCQLDGKAVKAATTQELGKTVFGNYITVDLLQTKILTCIYKLPTEIMSDENYELLVQKQAGTIATPFEFKLGINPNKPQTVEDKLNTDKTYRLELGE